MEDKSRYVIETDVARGHLLPEYLDRHEIFNVLLHIERLRQGGFLDAVSYWQYTDYVKYILGGDSTWWERARWIEDNRNLVKWLYSMVIVRKNNDETQG